MRDANCEILEVFTISNEDRFSYVQVAVLFINQVARTSLIWCLHWSLLIYFSNETSKVLICIWSYINTRLFFAVILCSSKSTSVATCTLSTNTGWLEAAKRPHIVKYIDLTKTWCPSCGTTKLWTGTHFWYSIEALIWMVDFSIAVKVYIHFKVFMLKMSTESLKLKTPLKKRLFPQPFHTFAEFFNSCTLIWMIIDVFCILTTQ